MPAALTPRQLARALAIGESTVKRWCDKGLIETIRTPGGHRKLVLADVLRFLREHHHSLVAPEVLGLPAVSQHAEQGLPRSRSQLVEALLAGNESLSRQVVFNLYLARHRVSVICDEVIAAAFHEIGERWECQQADVYQERRACEIVLKILFELRKVLHAPGRGWMATGGTIEGDNYALASAMAELVLRDAEFDAISLGSSIPLASMINAVRATRPKLFWLSVSHIREDLDFVHEFAALSAACADVGTALVVGGRALTVNLRQRMNYAAYGDTMQHLETFARTMRQAGTATAGGS